MLEGKDSVGNIRTISVANILVHDVVFAHVLAQLIFTACGGSPELSCSTQILFGCYIKTVQFNLTCNSTISCQ